MAVFELALPTRYLSFYAREDLFYKDIVLAWDASVSANGLAQYEPRRIGKSRFRDVAAGQGFLSAITDRGVLVVAKAPDFDPQIVESFLGMDCTQVSAGPRHVIALTAEGEVWCVFNEKLTDITAGSKIKVTFI